MIARFVSQIEEKGIHVMNVMVGQGLMEMVAMVEAALVQEGLHEGLVHQAVTTSAANYAMGF